MDEPGDLKIMLELMPATKIREFIRRRGLKNKIKNFTSMKKPELMVKILELRHPVFEEVEVEKKKDPETGETIVKKVQERMYKTLGGSNMLKLMLHDMGGSEHTDALVMDKGKKLTKKNLKGLLRLMPTKDIDYDKHVSVFPFMDSRLRMMM